jgi:hypothetical protein
MKGFINIGTSDPLHQTSRLAAPVPEVAPPSHDAERVRDNNKLPPVWQAVQVQAAGICAGIPTMHNGTVAALFSPGVFSYQFGYAPCLQSTLRAIIMDITKPIFSCNISHRIYPRFIDKLSFRTLGIVASSKLPPGIS